MVNLRPIMLLLLLVLLAPFTGCNEEERKARKDAYDANYPSGYQQGVAAGEKRGNKEGRERGAVAARAAADSGTAWQLYAVLAILALLCGLGVGLLIQYSVLLACRHFERLPQFSTVAFVPAMKLSFVYSVFDKRRKLKAKVDEELSKLAAYNDLQAAQIRALNEAVEMKIKALSSIEEFSQARLVELAAEELEKIVSAAAKKAETMRNARGRDETTVRITHLCSNCGCLVRFNIRLANETVSCPNLECGQPIRLPPVLSGIEGAPLILDVD
jgi:hypothetical protein